MTSAARIEANRRNALKSSGPKTAEGKARSSRNAVKHGLTAAVADDLDRSYQEFLKGWLEDARPVGAIESAMVERAAHAAWRLKKSAEQEAAVARFRARRAADLHQQAERARAVQLGERLVLDPLNRCAVYPKHDPAVVQRVAEWRRDDPTVLAGELELSSEGVDWKLARWQELARMLDQEGFWHYDARYRALKLAGLRPEDTLLDPAVERITLACNVLHPEAWDLWDECFQATLGVEGRPVYRYRVDLLRARRPDEKTAMATLRKFVADEVARLEGLKVTLAPRAKADRAEAADRAPREDAPAAALRLRYETASTRSMHSALAELARLRKSRLESEDVIPKKVTPRSTEPATASRPVEPREHLRRNEPKAPAVEGPSEGVIPSTRGVRNQP